MPNFSLFLAKLKKINRNESLQHISAPQYAFMTHRPLKTGFNHNIYWYKGPEIKKQATKRPQNGHFWAIFGKKSRRKKEKEPYSYFSA